MRLCVKGYGALGLGKSSEMPELYLCIVARHSLAVVHVAIYRRTLAHACMACKVHMIDGFRLLLVAAAPAAVVRATGRVHAAALAVVKCIPLCVAHTQCLAFADLPAYLPA